MRDTIFALATPPGRSGIAVIRLSGPGAPAAAEALAGGPLPPPRRAGLRRLRDADGAPIDEALVLSFPGPGSFTGEDVVELHCHGSRAVVRAVTDRLATLPGLRPAEAGEFTRRALIAGRMTLAEVEGLGDLLDAETERQRRQSFSLFDGAVAARVARWRAALVSALALCEAAIDFVEDDIPEDILERLAILIAELAAEFANAVREAAAGQGVREGFDIAIVGLPNSGKSSLINWLSGRDLALVSEVAGTTRDVIELRYDLDGLLVTFLDTAGLRASGDAVEAAGIDRAVARSRAAALRLFLSDPADTPQVEPRPGDLVRHAFADLGQGDFSTVDGSGTERLLRDVSAVLTDRADAAGIFSRDRHMAHLRSAADAATRASSALDAAQLDLVAEDLRRMAQELDELVGRIGAEMVLDELFSAFCIGK